MEEQIMSEIYHERQRLQLCLLHALNNLFQEKDAFTRSDLDAIAEKLILDDPTQDRWTPISVVFKPHHNLITGNYDVNVLIAALERRGKNVVWHDRRNGASSIDLDGFENGLMGIVLNVSVRRFAGLWKNRHWITLRKIGGVWYNLDSDLKAIWIAILKPLNHLRMSRKFECFWIVLLLLVGRFCSSRMLNNKIDNDLLMDLFVESINGGTSVKLFAAGLVENLKVDYSVRFKLCDYDGK